MDGFATFLAYVFGFALVVYIASQFIGNLIALPLRMAFGM